MEFAQTFFHPRDIHCLKNLRAENQLYLHRTYQQATLYLQVMIKSDPFSLMF